MYCEPLRSRICNKLLIQDFTAREIKAYVVKTSNLIGIKCAYLYAAGDQSLVDYYQQVFEFKTTSHQNYIPIKPYYNTGCQFMYYLL